MSTSARRRLMRDFKVCPAILLPVPNLDLVHSDPTGNITDPQQRMQTDPPAGVSASPIADNVMTW